MAGTNNDAMAAFVEQGSIENGFKQVFDAEIAPSLAMVTHDGSSLRSRTLRDLKSLAAIAAIAFVGIMIMIMVDAAAGMVACIGIAIFAGYLVYRRQSRWEQQVIDAVLPSVCAFLDLRYARTLFPDDYVDKTHQREEGSSSPVFHGLLFRIQVPVNVRSRMFPVERGSCCLQ